MLTRSRFMTGICASLALVTVVSFCHRRVAATVLDVDRAPATCDGLSTDQAHRACLGRLVAETPTIGEAQIAPNGRGVVYTIARGAVATNDYVTELYLQRLTREHAPDGAPEVLHRQAGTSAPAAFPAKWCPRGECVSYFEPAPEDSEPRTLLRYDLATRRTTRLEVRDVAATPTRPRVTAISGDYVWAPSGTMLAFTAPVTPPNLDPRHGVHWPVHSEGPIQTNGLFALDVKTGAVTQISPSTLHVESWPGRPGFSWSPDERALAVTATLEAGYWADMRTDLYVIDRISHAVRSLVVQPGGDTAPSWSPDGRWIAFRSEGGRESNLGLLRIVPAEGGPLRRMAGKDPRSYGSGTSDTWRWSPDSDAVYFTSSAQMTYQLFRVAVAGAPDADLLPPATPMLGDGQVFTSQISVSHDTQTVAFCRSRGASPAELYVADLSAQGSGTPRPLTHVGAAFRLRDAVRVDTVSWPSPDGRFTISGVVLTPAAAWRDGRVTRPLPTIVNMKGQSPGTELGEAFPELPAVLRGFAVFAPQVRGRNGLSADFLTGLRDGQSYIRLPMEDTLAGVDALIRRGIADPTRLGLYGLSQGGTQTAGIITMTNRFKAAIVREAHTAELLGREFLASASPDGQRVNRVIGGGDVYDPATRARLEAESPVYNLHRVSTPTLLLFGAKSYAPTVGLSLFNGLQRHGVPSEFVVYDEGHGVTRPAAVTDFYVRTLAWFEYWLRDVPYPDPDRQREYDNWKREHRAEHR